MDVSARQATYVRQQDMYTGTRSSIYSFLPYFYPLVHESCRATMLRYINHVIHASCTGSTGPPVQAVQDACVHSSSVCCLHSQSSSLPSFISIPSVRPHSLSWGNTKSQTERQTKTKNKNNRESMGKASNKMPTCRVREHCTEHHNVIVFYQNKTKTSTRKYDKVLDKKPGCLPKVYFLFEKDGFHATLV